MRRILILVLSAGCLLAAQEKVKVEPLAEGKEMVSAVIPVKTLSGDAFHRLVKLLNAFKVSFSADDRLRTIVVYAEKDVVEQMKKVIQELDRPGSEAAVGKNAEMTLTFLRCSRNPLSGTTLDALPADLEPVAKQLRAATQYKHVELWDVVPLRIQEGRAAEQTARLPAKPLGGSNSFPGAFPTANIRVTPESVSVKDGTRSVRFQQFNIGFRIPYVTQPVPNATQHQFMDIGLQTSGDFKEGQKTVLGKVGLDDESAVFVVVALKVLD